MFAENKSNLIYKTFVFIIISVVFAVLSYKLKINCIYRKEMFFYREIFLTSLYGFFCCNLFIGIRKVFNFIFKKRIIFGFILFFVLVILKINFSSIPELNNYIQPGSGSQMITPIFGSSKSIRSDEWAIDTLKHFTYQFTDGKTNHLIMATEFSDLCSSGLQLSLSLLAKPFHIGYYFLPTDYALSFLWCGILIFSFLATLELFLIMTERNKIYSVLGACLTIFSSFFLWWSIVVEITYGIGAVVFLYYFIQSQKTFKKVLFGFLISVFGSAFICELYPAWMVPFGYVFLGIALWIIISNFNSIKSFCKSHWFIFAFVVALALLIAFFYYRNKSQYIKTITQTVYPGKRQESGEYSLYKLFLYPTSLKFPFDYKNINTSEYGTFITFFPLPVIMSVFAMIKAKNKDTLSIILLCISTVYIVYCSIGLPSFLAKILLLSYSTAFRLVDVLGFTQLLLLIRSLYLFKKHKISFPKIAGFLLITAIILLTYFINKTEFKDYISEWLLLGILLGLFAIAYIILSFKNEKFKEYSIILLAMVTAGVNLYILPINATADVVYSKPAANAAMELSKESPNANWITLNQWVDANFYAACGVKVLNSNNYMPNLKMWESLFGKKYEDIYNRYSNLIISLTDDNSYPELLQPDLINLHLNFNDLKNLKIGYIATHEDLIIPSKYNIFSYCIYNENGVRFYQLTY